MGNLHVFNLCHDLALACGSPSYCPPQRVACLERDLLPLALATMREGDMLVVDDRDVDAINSRRAARGLAGTVVGRSSLRKVAADVERVLPWGWDERLAAWLRRSGVTCLPTAARLNSIRKLASKATADEVLRRLGSHEGWCGASSEVFTVEAAAIQVAAYGASVLKAPWSSSGRGLRRVADGELTAADRQWVAGVIGKQGSVVIQPWFDKILDLAAEFIADAEGVRFEGFSLFLTDRFSYKGNLLLPQRELKRRAALPVGERLLSHTVERLAEVLSELTRGKYEGPLGVDMMVCRVGDAALLNPCIELNARMTMGMLAMRLYEATAKTGLLRIGRVEECGGYPLLPPLRGASFTAWIEGAT